MPGCLAWHALLHRPAPRSIPSMSTYVTGPFCLRFSCSEFVSAELDPGTVVRNVRHEDLQRTSFADNTFDLVISTEVRPASPLLALFFAR